MTALKVEIWSDIACPWCYVGKRRWEAALSQFSARNAVSVQWRAFELNPDAPQVQDDAPYAERLAKKYGMSLQEAEARIANLTAIARADGIEMDFQRIRPGNTFDAHRLVKWARSQGLEHSMKERLLRAYLCEGEAIGTREALVRIAADAGFNADEAASMLETAAYAADVRADEAEALALGIRGVPFFVLARQYGVSGAQPHEVLLRAVEQAYAELTPELHEGAACGPDGC
jgi:predicted DsbA family dithiol-disulfide isomerase